MEKLIALDIDGVLNTHNNLENGYTPIERENRLNFNKLLAAVPEAQIVVISAWRYYVLNGSMNLQGLQNLFLSHGLNIHGKLHGITVSDEEIAEELGYPKPDFMNIYGWYDWIHEHGIEIRRIQVNRYLSEFKPSNFVVLDDLPLNLSNQIQTGRNIGLTEKEAMLAAEILNKTS
jgi:hypothetical protein